MDIGKTKQVFISYSSKDRAVADTICSVFEKNDGLTCWIAPRNIGLGQTYPAAITLGIKSSDVLIVLLSKNTDDSKYVYKEVELAHSFDVPILPVRISDASIENPDLQFLCSILQMYDVFGESREQKIVGLAEKIISNEREIGRKLSDKQSETKHKLISVTNAEKETASESPPPEAEKSIGGLPRLKSLVPYPVAAGLWSVIEQEINPNAEAYNATVFNLVELVVKFCASVLIAAYRTLDDVQSSTRMDSVVAEVAHGHLRNWMQVIHVLCKYLKDREELPDFVRAFVNYLTRSEIGTDLREPVEVITAKVKVSRLKKYQDYPNIHLLAAAVEYQSSFFQKQSSDSEYVVKNIRDTMEIWLSRFEAMLTLKLAAINSFWPDKKSKTFVHNIITFKNLQADADESHFISENWDIIDPRHVIIYNKEDMGNYLDLFPFFIASEKFDDLLIWEKTDDFSHIVTRQLRDSVSKDLEIGLDTFLGRIKAHAVNIKVQPDGCLEDGSIADALNSVRELIANEVKNPICAGELETRLKSLEEYLEAEHQKGTAIVSEVWVDKLNQIKILALKGMYPKLEPTDHDYLLTDEYKGLYIIPDRFFDAHPDLKKDFAKSSGILKKEASKEVSVILYLAAAEARRGLFGVEHLMTAMSKLCSRLVLDWYDAIGIPPKHHRDLVRTYLQMQAIDTRVEDREGLYLKQRLINVFAMAVEEANLAKHETVSLEDVFSAILREGYSLPIRVLTNYYGLTRDRLLNEFYMLLRKTC